MRIIVCLMLVCCGSPGSQPGAESAVGSLSSQLEPLKLLPRDAQPRWLSFSDFNADAFLPVTPVEFVETQRTGSECQTLAEPVVAPCESDACTVARSAPDPGQGFAAVAAPMSCFLYLHASAGGRPLVVSSPSEIKTFFGKIDSVEEAGYLTLLDGYLVADIRAEDGVFRASTMKAQCAALLTIARSGEIVVDQRVCY